MTDATTPETAPTAPITPAAEPSAAPAPVSPSEPVVIVEPTVITETPAASSVDDVLGGEGELVVDPVTPEATPEKPSAEPEAPKTDAEKKDGEPAKTESAADAPAELPTYAEFTLPENINLDKETIGEFSKLLGEIEVGKLDHDGVQAQGQKFIDLGTKLVTESLQRMTEHYVAIHEKQKADWFQEFKADPEIGGARTNTTINAVRSAIETYGGTPEQIAKFRETTKKTGVTNNPDVIRLISNMANTIAKFTTEQENGLKDTRIVPGARPAPTVTKPYKSFYGAK